MHRIAFLLLIITTLPVSAESPPSQKSLAGWLLGIPREAVRNEFSREPLVQNDGTYEYDIYFMSDDQKSYIAFGYPEFRPDRLFVVQLSGGKPFTTTKFNDIELRDRQSKLFRKFGKPDVITNREELNRENYSYNGRNYSFEVDKKGRIWSIRIDGREGLVVASGWPEKWEAYKPYSITQSVADVREHFESCRICLNAVIVKRRTLATFTGEIRVLDDEEQEFKSMWIKAANLSPDSIVPINYAIQVEEQGNTYWLAIQDSLVEPLREEVLAGCVVEIFFFNMGSRENGEKPMIGVNEFRAPSWSCTFWVNGLPAELN